MIKESYYYYYYDNLAIMPELRSTYDGRLV